MKGIILKVELVRSQDNKGEVKLWHLKLTHHECHLFQSNKKGEEKTIQRKTQIKRYCYLSDCFELESKISPTWIEKRCFGETRALKI